MNTIEDLFVKVAVLEKRISIQQGLTEILLNFAQSKYGSEDLHQHFKLVAESANMSAEARSAALVMIQQQGLWGQALSEGRKQ